MPGTAPRANLTCPGPDRLIAVGKGRDLEKAARDPGQRQPGPGAAPPSRPCAKWLKTPEGITAYRQRGHIAETPHGPHQAQHGLAAAVGLRGKRKASAELRVYLRRAQPVQGLLSTGHLTSQARTARPADPASQRHPPRAPAKAVTAAQPVNQFRNSPQRADSARWWSATMARLTQFGQEGIRGIITAGSALSYKDSRAERSK